MLCRGRPDSRYQRWNVYEHGTDCARSGAGMSMHGLLMMLQGDDRDGMVDHAGLAEGRWGGCRSGWDCLCSTSTSTLVL